MRAEWRFYWSQPALLSFGTMWLRSAVSKSLCGLDDGYINTVGLELPIFVMRILTAKESIRPLASISPEMLWDHISSG